jgi:hypothetical protein
VGCCQLARLGRWAVDASILHFIREEETWSFHRLIHEDMVINLSLEMESENAQHPQETSARLDI